MKCLAGLKKEFNFDVFGKGGFSNFKVGTEQLEDVRCDHTMHLGHVATFSKYDIV